MVCAARPAPPYNSAPPPKGGDLGMGTRLARCRLKIQTEITRTRYAVGNAVGCARISRMHASNDHMHLIDNHFLSQGACSDHKEVAPERSNLEASAEENEGFCYCFRAIEEQKQVSSELFGRI